MNETNASTVQPVEEDSAAACTSGTCCPYTAATVALVAGLVIGFVAGRIGRKSANPAQGKTQTNGRNGRDKERNGRDERRANRRPEREERPARREEVVVHDRARLEEPVRGPLPPGSVELYVGNLSYTTTDDSLNAAFAPHGEIVQARVVLNRYNGKSKGFGFVVMKSRADAEKAIAAMNETELEGRRLRVNEARTGESAE